MKLRSLASFPSKERYEFHKYTLEGREAVHAEEEPNYDLEYDPAPMHGPAVTSAPPSTASGVTSSAPHYPPGVHGYAADTKGRMHPID